ncbi:MAG: TlpA family protein disulfide reductase [Gemmatimonadetes bacterium]|nr:TlpA family protein disulfide reductase [Gemmatimonadota bacterium]
MTTHPPLWRRFLSIGNLVTLLLVAWAAPRLLPHLGALVGAESGGRRLPTWSAQTLAGTMIGSDSLRGQVVLVNVWATWCLPCRAEMPLLEAMHQRHRARGFAMVGLSVDRGPETEVRAFLAEREITYPVAIVPDAFLNVFGGVRGYPTSFLIDRAGVIRHAVIGPLAPATLELAVRRLLDAS